MVAPADARLARRLVLESRVRDLADMIQIYERFAADVRPRV